MAIKVITPLKGSGPVPGVLEISNRSQSNKAVKNYFPSQKVQTRGGTVILNNIEFVFAPQINTFLVGRLKYAANNLTGHPALARILGYESKDDNIVGGMFSREHHGEFFTTEHSGHYWQNWNDLIRNQFIEFMKSKGIEINHSQGL